MGVINSILKPSVVQRDTLLHPYETLAQPMSCYGTEAWTIKKQDTNRITACEMQFVQRTAGYTKWGHNGNEAISDKLKIKPVINYIRSYQESMKGTCKQTEYRMNHKTNSTLLAKRTKINWTFIEEMGGKVRT
jgi:hypothetical protein